MKTQAIDSNTVAHHSICAKRLTTSHPKMIFLALFLACLCLCSAQLFAGTVNSGYILITGPQGSYGGGSFDLVGTGFTVSGDFATQYSWYVQIPLGQNGGTLSVQGAVAGTDFSLGSATIGSTYYPSVNWGSAYNGPPGSRFTVTGGPDIQVTGPGTYNTTFSMTGTLCGMVSGPPYGPCDISLKDVSGSGTVIVDIGQNQNGSLYLEDATYYFGGSTPEPSSLLLFGSGIVGLGGLLRRRFLG